MQRGSPSHSFPSIFTGALVAGLALAACNSAPAPRPRPTTPPDESQEQGPSFYPANYQGEMFFDFQAMRDNGLLDRLERLPMMGEFLEGMAHSTGGDFEDLDRMRSAVVYDQEGRRAVQTVTVCEGTGFARPTTMPESWKAVRLGGLDGWCSDGPAVHETVLVWPQPGLAVRGDQLLLEPILAGGMATGRAHPELRHFLRGDGVLIQYGFGCFGRPPHVHLGTIGFPGGWMDAGDPVTFLRLRLAQDENVSLTLSMTLRFQRATTGRRLVESEIETLLARVSTNKDYAVFKPLLGSITLANDGPDLTVSLPLGTPREAVVKVERAVMALMRITAEQRGR